MGQPAARIGDMLMCPLQTPTPAGPIPHAVPPGNPIAQVGCPTVLIGGLPAARVGDMSMCITPGGPLPNAIAKGAMPVRIGGSPAARATDQGSHPGSQVAPPCCPTVLIGLAGTSGNPWAANTQCQNAAAGRSPPPSSTDSAGNPLQSGTPGQSYNNCGVESSRQIINQYNPGTPMTQEGLLNQALGKGSFPSVTQSPTLGSKINGVTVTSQNQLYFSGGTTPPAQVALLGQNGVPATTVSSGVSNIETPLANGDAAIANLDAGVLWPAEMPGRDAASFGLTPGNGNGHAVLVTGAEYDENGNLTHVYINDTGLGLCKQKVPVSDFENAQKSFASYCKNNGFSPPQNVVTKVPVW